MLRAWFYRCPPMIASDRGRPVEGETAFDRGRVGDGNLHIMLYLDSGVSSQLNFLFRSSIDSSMFGPLAGSWIVTVVVVVFAQPRRGYGRRESARQRRTA